MSGSSEVIAEAIRDDAAGRGSSPGTDENAVLFREANEIPDDQEVIGQLHVADYAKLVRNPVFDIAVGKVVPLGCPLADQVLEIFVVRVSVWHIEIGKLEARR